MSSEDLRRRRRARQQKSPGQPMAPELSALTGGTPPQGGAEEANPFQVPPSRVGLYMTSDHRYYVNGEGPIVSVTTALEIIDKPWLKQWLIDQTALAAMTHLPELLAIGSVEEGQAFLRKAPREIRDRAGDLGTMVHQLSDMPLGASESHAKGFEVPSEAIPYLEAYRGFCGFLEAHGGKIISSEKAVYNKTEGYAGTYDRLILFDCDCHKGLWCVDLKTSRDYYPEFGLQCIAYSRAEYIVLPDDPTLYPMPQIDRMGVLHLRPDKYPGPFSEAWRLVEYLTTDRDWIAFLAALDLYKWRAEGRFRKSILNSTTQKPI